MGRGGIAPAQVNEYTNFTDSPTYFSSLTSQIEWFPCFIPFSYTDTNAAFIIEVLFPIFVSHASLLLQVVKDLNPDLNALEAHVLSLHQRPIFLSQLFMYILYKKFIKNAMLNLRFELRHK